MEKKGNILVYSQHYPPYSHFIPAPLHRLLEIKGSIAEMRHSQWDCTKNRVKWVGRPCKKWKIKSSGQRNVVRTREKGSCERSD